MANERTWLGGERESGMGVSDCRVCSACMPYGSRSMIVHVYVMSCEPPRRCSGFESQARGGGGVALSESGCAAVVYVLLVLLVRVSAVEWRGGFFGSTPATTRAHDWCLFPTGGLPWTPAHA